MRSNEVIMLVHAVKELSLVTVYFNIKLSFRGLA